jgi:hypothetical protein
LKEENDMTAADLSLMAFAGCNVLRIAAYVPQMVKLACHPDAAPSFSYATWALFAAANLSTTAYAQVVLADAVLAAAHGLSAACCGALIGFALWRRSRPLTHRTSALRQSRKVQVIQERGSPWLHAHRRKPVAQVVDAAERAVP